MTQPATTSPLFRRILCPTDFSPCSQHALQRATELARATGSKLMLLHVLPVVTFPLPHLAAMTGLAELQMQLRAQSEQNLQKLRAGIAGIEVTTEVREGSAHAEILAAAAATNADLIVIGTEGHTGLAHALLGSTAERVVRLSKCPVMTVRTPG